jgi:membrane-bound lytic murein transglycosylase D
LRLPPRLVALALTLALAACATPGPPPADPAPAPVIVAAAPEPPPPAPPAAPPVVVRDPFPSAAGADLEPLPPPADDLWDRIRKGFAIPDLDPNDRNVEKWEQWYAARPDYVARMVERSRRYLYHIVAEVESRGMPTEIALLPMIESAYNPVALSTARAAGIWQFMPSTGKHYGLKQDFWMDSRRDVLSATEGALNYLEKLHGDFSDWQLALAAYNWGEGNVARAVERNRKLGKPTAYADLAMPDETRNYLPKLQAVKNIVTDPEKYGLQLEDIPDAPYFAVVTINRRIDVKKAAELAEIPQEEFQYLNAHHNRPVIAGADQQSILLPIDKAELFAAKLELTDQPLVSWQAYRLKPGETLAMVAVKFGLSVETLRAVNGIGPRSKPRAGHTVLVPAQRPAEADASLTTAVFTTVPQGRTFYYRVKRGDSLTQVAARYGVTVDDLRRWNGLSASAALAPGQPLRVTSDLAPVASKARRGATRVGKAPAGKAKAVPTAAAKASSSGSGRTQSAAKPAGKSAATTSPGTAAKPPPKSSPKSPAKSAATTSPPPRAAAAVTAGDR